MREKIAEPYFYKSVFTVYPGVDENGEYQPEVREFVCCKWPGELRRPEETDAPTPKSDDDPLSMLEANDVVASLLGENDRPMLPASYGEPSRFGEPGYIEPGTQHTHPDAQEHDVSNEMNRSLDSFSGYKFRLRFHPGYIASGCINSAAPITVQAVEHIVREHQKKGTLQAFLERCKIPHF